ncbi:CPBP family intramembrane glutamic endopeptidase [Staphylococcus coagulans]|uniref:CPBP family intramembrane glutamic endopeptidase n=1 Tax=Staphylococcus coagulans TaxID=74706 RepID=UPI0015FD4963|nr:CPBP family intramembrane glutamic endopeptidase [Staphylococcus coagulans]MBA8762862.1 CPBP family intramembrane metalloprotease [Staphylococcus coagulans]
MKKTIAQMFREDNLVNNDPLIKRWIKGAIFILLFIIYIGESTVLETISFKAVIYFLVLIAMMYLMKYFKIELFSFKKLTARDISIVIIFTVIVKVLDIIFVNFVSGTTLNQEHIEDDIQNISILNAALFFALLPAILEETVFRGLILRVMCRGHLFIGLIISSLLFAYIHEYSNLIEFLPYLYSGLLFGIAYLLTRRIEVSILIHFLGNFTSLWF